MSATTHDKPTVGLPPEQLQQWLHWVREDLQQLALSIEFMLSEQVRLAEQERLLGQLIETLPAVPSAADAEAPHSAESEAPHDGQSAAPAGEALPRRDEDDSSDDSALPAMPQFDVSWLIDPPS